MFAEMIQMHIGSSRRFTSKCQYVYVSR